MDESSELWHFTPSETLGLGFDMRASQTQAALRQHIEAKRTGGGNGAAR